MLRLPPACRTAVVEVDVMRRGLVWMVAVGGLLAAVPASGGERTLHALDDYALLGRNEVQLGGGTLVEGGHVGAIGGRVELRRNARVTENVAADTIELRRGASAGSFTCHFMEGPGTAICGALTLPVADLSNLRLSQPPLGAVAIDVPRRTRSAPVAPGEFGDVAVNVRGDLILAGGSYVFRSLTIASRGRLRCQTKCNIRVQNEVLLRQRAVLGATAPLDARAVRLDLESGGKAFTTRPRVTVAATVYAPQGTIFLGRRGRFEGAFVGSSVITGTAVRVKENSAL